MRREPKSTSLLSDAISPSTIGRQSVHHEVTVEDDEVEKVIKVNDSELPSVPRRLRITKESLRGSGTQTVALAATLCVHSNRPRGTVNTVVVEFKMILKVQRKLDRGSRRCRGDSRRPWSEEVRGQRVLGCERQCIGMRKGLHRLQPRQEAVIGMMLASC